MCNWCISFSMHTLSCQGQRYAGLLIAVICKGLVIKFSKGMEPKKILGKEGWYENSRIRVKDHGYMHHSYLHHTNMHQDQVSYIFVLCIMQIFIGIKDQRYVHHTYMHQGQGCGS